MKLEAIKALIDAATPGPWECVDVAPGVDLQPLNIMCGNGECLRRAVVALATAIVENK